MGGGGRRVRNDVVASTMRAAARFLREPDGPNVAAVEFGGCYSYDARNRLASWTPAGGSESFFTYDALGNLTGHGVASPRATNQRFGPTGGPHPPARGGSAA